MSDGPATVLGRIARETSLFAALQVAASVVVWCTTLALTRLLDKRAFGVYAIGTLLLGLGALLGDGGLGAALLRKRDDVTDDEYAVTGTFLLGVGAAMAAVLVAAMPFVAARYHLTPGEASVLRVMAPLYLVAPLRAVPYLRLERALRFGAIARVELLATLVRQLVAIALAWRVGGAWSLAGGQLAGAAVQVALAWQMSPGRFALAWRPAVLRPLLGYGVRVQALAMAAFFKDNLSAMLLGALRGPGAVGVFDFGVKYAQLPVQAVNALARVQLPAYARFEARDPALHGAVVAVTRTALLLGVATLVALGAGAPSIVPLVYGAQWLESVPVVWGLGANMAGGLVAGPLFALLQAQGRAGLALHAFLVWTAATWILAVAVRGGGIAAIALAYSAATVVMTAWLAVWAGRHLGRSVARAWLGPLGAGGVAVALLAVAHWTTALHALVASGWRAAGVGLAAYVVALVALDGARLADDLRSLRSALRRR